MELDHRVLTVDGKDYTLPTQACFQRHGSQLVIKCGNGPFTVELKLEALMSSLPANVAQEHPPIDQFPDSIMPDAGELISPPLYLQTASDGTGLWFLPFVSSRQQGHLS